MLLLGLALRPLPLAPLGPALKAALWAVRRRHPDLLERLGELDSPTFLIDPTDLPFAFRFHADPLRPRLEAVAEAPPMAATAVIRGPLLALVDLVEGRIDGDTLFFRRDLVVEGDTEAVVALRNALESAEIELARDLLAPLGPLSRLLARPLARLLEDAGSLFSRLAEDLETVRSAAIWPAIRLGEGTAGEVERLGEVVAELERRGRRRRAAG